jgi:hypothetical protein
MVNLTPAVGRGASLLVGLLTVLFCTCLFAQGAEQSSQDNDHSAITLTNPTDASIALLEEERFSELELIVFEVEGLTSEGIRSLLARDSLISLSIHCHFKHKDMILQHLPQSLKRFKSTGYLRDGQLSTLVELPQLVELQIQYSGPGATFRNLAKLKSLETLSIGISSGSRVGDADVAYAFRALSNLQSVSLTHSRLAGNKTCEALASLENLAHLRFLLLHGMTDADIGLLSGAPSLQRLEIELCDGLTDAVWAHFKQFEALVALSFLRGGPAGSEHGGINNVHLCELGKASSLQELSFLSSPSWSAPGAGSQSFHFIVDPTVYDAESEAFRSLKRLTLKGQSDLEDKEFLYMIQANGLEQVSLSTCISLSESALAMLARHESLNDFGAFRVPGLTSGVLRLMFEKCKLESIYLSTIDGFDDEAASLLAARDACRTLRLHACHSLTSQGIQAIASMTNLHLLDLLGTRAIDTDACAALGRMKSLVTLNLSETNVDDEGVVLLAKSKSLRALGLHGCNVSEAAIRKLLSQLDLERLGIRRCPGIDEKVLAQLRKDFPSCSIDG